MILKRTKMCDPKNIYRTYAAKCSSRNIIRVDKYRFW